MRRSATEYERLQLAFTVVRSTAYIRMCLCVFASDTVCIVSLFLCLVQYVSYMVSWGFRAAQLVFHRLWTTEAHSCCSLWLALRAAGSSSLSSQRAWLCEGGCETVDRWMYRNGEVEVRDECKRLKGSEETEHNQKKSCALVLLNGVRFECFCAMRFEWMNRL